MSLLLSLPTIAVTAAQPILTPGVNEAGRDCALDDVIASFKSSFCSNCQQSYRPLDHLRACGHQISRVDRAVVERIIDVTLRLEGIKRVAIVGR